MIKEDMMRLSISFRLAIIAAAMIACLSISAVWVEHAQAYFPIHYKLEPVSEYSVGDRIPLRFSYHRDRADCDTLYLTASTMGGFEYFGDTEISVPLDRANMSSGTYMFDAIIPPNDTSAVIFVMNCNGEDYEAKLFFVTTGDTLETWDGDPRDWKGMPMARSDSIHNESVKRHLEYIEAVKAGKVAKDVKHANATEPPPPRWTAGNFVDPRDGNIYKWVRIGDQIWLAENLRFATESGSWCWENKDENCQARGRFYNWETAMQAAPLGWHLPSDEEWKELEITLGLTEEQVDLEGFRVDKDNNLAGKIKMTGGWPDSYKARSLNVTNETGFSAVQSGIYSNGEFSHDGYAGWWTSTESDSSAWIRHMGFFDNTIGRVLNRKEYAFPIRCVKDSSP